MQHKRSLTKKFVGVWVPRLLKQRVDVMTAKRGVTIQKFVESAIERELSAAK